MRKSHRLDKTEELKQICLDWLWKAFETGTEQDSFSADNSEFWHPMIDLNWSKEMAKEIGVLFIDLIAQIKEDKS